MWATLDKISEQVTKYTTCLGQLWYVLVFIFRLIVVASLGGAVYGDEQSAFKCSQDIFGCTNMCYNQFAKISHLRFWAFQLIAVASPTVFFHMYTLRVSGEIQKLKNSQNGLKQMEAGDGVPYTNKIKFAYHASVLCRLVLEGMFLYLGYLLFNKNDKMCLKKDGDCLPTNSLGSILWLEVPGTYYCTGESDPIVYKACGQHFALMWGALAGFIPCTVSRPYEKTVFLRYMTVLSVLCFLICALELIVAFIRKLCLKRHWFKYSQRPLEVQRDSVFNYSPFNTAPSAPAKLYDEQQFFPTLAVPVKLGTIRFSEKTKTNCS